MMAADYVIEIRHRKLRDGRTIYGVTVGQNMRKAAVDPGDGLGSAYLPRDTHEEAVEAVRSVLDRYQDPDERQPGRPVPTAENTELRDETSEFNMSQFFEKGTLAAYMAAE